MGALSGIRILDLSRVLAGPWCAQTLADLGADVIKVERTECGDDTRAWGPPWFKSKPGRDDESAYFLTANRNKKSIAIDFSTEEGAALVCELVKESDVLVENFKVGTLARYGLDYPSLAKLNPRLVYCSITGFGQDGPYAGRAGYDFLIQGMGGLMSITGQPDGHPGEGPQKVGVALTDILTGLYATTGILAALMKTRETGKGQHIDVALLDVQVACLANQAMNYLVSNNVPQRIGNAHPNIVPYQDFPTRNGHIIVAIGNDAQFKRFCDIVKNPQWAEDINFSKNSARIQNREALIPKIATVLARETSEHWILALEQGGVPCGPINSIADVFADPQVKHREMLVKIKDGLNSEMPSVANPIRMSDTPVEYRLPPPGLGENSREILQGLLKLSDLNIKGLTERKIINCA